jgi:hypothetical protein
MVDTYGSDKMRSLLAALKDGGTVDEAFKKGVGLTLDQFETRWKNNLKSGAATKAASQRATQGRSGSTGSAGTQVGGDGFVDRLFGPAIRFWEGIFGAYTRPVLIGAGSLIGAGLLAVIGGSIYGAIRKAREED